MKRLKGAFFKKKTPKPPEPQTTQTQTEVKKKSQCISKYSVVKWHNLLNWSLEKSMYYEKWHNP